MAYVRTMRGPRPGRHGHFVPGGLACAAARPLTLSASALPLVCSREPEEAPGAASLTAKSDRVASVADGPA